MRKTISMKKNRETKFKLEKNLNYLTKNNFFKIKT